MKSLFYTLLSVVMFSFVSCNRAEQTERSTDDASTSLSPIEEMRLAFQTFKEAREAEVEGQKEKSLDIYNKAFYHYARIVVRTDANDTLRSGALYRLYWIEAVQRQRYGVALQYLNQCMAITPKNDNFYAHLCAYKADGLWHIEELDSAIHYAKLALQTPHHQPAVEYMSGHVLWKSYEKLGVRDSANHYKQLHIKARDGKLYKEQTMDELISELSNNVIANGMPEVKEDLRPSEVQKRDPQFKAQKWRQRVYRIILLLLLLSPFAIGYYRKHYHRKHLIHEEQQSSPADCQTACNESMVEASEEERGESFTLPEALILRRSLDDGRRAFENTASFTDLNSMQIKEKELYDMAYEATRDVESALFTSFKDACNTLHEDLELNDQELICCFCSYLGYTNNVIAYIGHTTPTTIRKRKERIRKKLPTDFCEIIFRGNAGDK